QAAGSPPSTAMELPLVNAALGAPRQAAMTARGGGRRRDPPSVSLRPTPSPARGDGRSLRGRLQLLGLAAGRPGDELEDGLGDLGLEAFGVALVQAHDIGDHPAALAVRIDVEPGLAGSRLHPP